MTVASVRETANFTNNTNAVTPYTLGQVLSSYATQSYVTDAIAHAQIDPSQVDLHEYAKKTDLPTKLSQLTNDDNYVQTVGGFIPSNLLPSYVDDVIEKANYAALPRPGEAGKIYVTLDDNLTYRWSGSDYVEISKSLALGTTSSTAYRGDYGDIAYQHSQIQGNPHGTDLTDMGVTISAAVLNYLTGLDGNIMTKLAAKVNKAGDTMTGFLTLHADPTQKMHAANKDYVDKEINGISVTVTQNVTAISELQGDVSGLTSTVGAQADTLVEVQSDVTGLKQTTDSHTTAISRIDQDISGISSTVEETQTSVTHLEASVNQLDVVFDSVAIFVLVDSDRYPQQNATYDMNYQCKFRGNDVDPDTVTITGSHTGITTSTASGKLRFTVATSTAIPTEANKYTATFTYVSGGLTWTVNKLVMVVTVLQGEQGIQGPPGEDAVSIVSITEYFYKSDSPTELTGGSWVTIYPGWQDGKYIWTKLKTVYSDTTYEETTPMCVTGATGSTGQQGVSITNVDILYYQSTSATTLDGGSWETTVPTYEDGKFMWTKQRVTYSNGFSDETAPVCVTGSQGKSPVIVHITSSNGLIFKDTSVSTILNVAVYYNDLRITDITALREALGSSVFLQWKWKRIRDQDYGVLPVSDPRISDDGFTLTLDVGDIDTQVTFICEVIVDETPPPPPPEPVDTEVKFYYPGEKTFDKSEMISTKVKLFSSENQSKNWYVSFDIGERKTSGYESMATLFNCKDESGTPWPGIDFRYKSSAGGYFQSKYSQGTRNTYDYAADIQVSVANTKRVEYLKIGTNIYKRYSNNLEQIGNFTLWFEHANNYPSGLYFDGVAQFGGHSYYFSQGQRRFEGTLSNMLVEFISDEATIENYEDYI